MLFSFCTAVKEPPYKLDECGYGSFELKIEVCFKTRDEPRKVMFTYDLFLPLIGYPPVTNVRTEALTFTHPTEDFMKKLIKGGGLQISASNGVRYVYNCRFSIVHQIADSLLYIKLQILYCISNCRFSIVHQIADSLLYMF